MCDLDSIEYARWDKMYAFITCEMIDIVDACIACGIKFHFNGPQHILGLFQGGILKDLTCLIAFIMVPLSIR